MHRTFVALLFLPLSIAVAQQPYLVKDMRTSGPTGWGSIPRYFTVLGAWTYFSASTREISGLWRTDGTAAGTTLVEAGNVFAIARLGDRLIYGTDYGIRATDGTTATTISPIRNVNAFTELNGRLYFSGHDANGWAVWVTDGSADGTSVISPPSRNYVPLVVGHFGDRIIRFSPDQGLFLTDGTSAGTTLLTDKLADVGVIVTAGDRLFFPAKTSDSADGYELWVSDGTAAGTHLVPRINPSHPTFDYKDTAMAAVGNRLLFVSYTGQPWMSDGTSAGTALLKQMSVSGSIFTLNGIAYFVGSDDHKTYTLWRSDGTASGTQPVGVPNPLVTLAFGADRLWLSAYANGQYQLGISDGTVTGTRFLANVQAWAPFVSFNGHYVFAATDSLHGIEPWWTDGTPQGTSIIDDLVPNLAPSSFATPVNASASQVLFTANDDTGQQKEWSSDGTAAGTQLTNVPTGSLRFRDLLYFFGTSGRLTASDGTPGGTRVVKDAPTGYVIAAAELLYAFGATGVWAIDDPNAGAVHTFPWDDSPSKWIALAGRLVYVNYSGFLEEIAGYDPPRTIVSLPAIQQLGQAGGRIFYFSDSRLYSTDGTADGVKQLAAFRTSGLMLGAAAGRLLFTADDGVHGMELWSSDGTAEGTQLVQDIWPGSGTSNITMSAALDGRIVFVADDGLFGPRLWSSDGTPQGTTVIGDWLSSINSLSAAKGLAFFRASDGIHGRELWQSDGTTAGTTLVADIYPGPDSSDPASFAATRDLLFFEAATLEAGFELWALPIPWRTIAIADAHATATATNATMAVTLDAAASTAVSAGWTSATGASGSVTFAPGETRKTIAFPITPDPASPSNRMIAVRLHDVRGAVGTKTYATLIVDRGAPSADLQVSVRHSASTVGYRDLVVRNLGPDSVPRVVVTAPGLQLPTIAPGASASRSVYLTGTYSIAAAGSIADPDPSNNRTTLQVVASGSDTISISPVALHAGMHATVTITTAALAGASLTSSDPSVIAVPASAPTPSDLDVIALKSGKTTITATNAANGHTVSIDVIVVGADETYRWPSRMTFTIDAGDRTFGVPQHLVAKFAGQAFDAGVTPTGAVTFTDGTRVVAVAHVDANATAEATIDWFSPGSHTLTASYEGDAHFFADASAAPSITIGAPPAVTFHGTYDPRSPTTAELTIVVVTPRAAAAGGTITLATSQGMIAEDVPVVNGIARVVAKRVDVVTVLYSGDGFYAPAVMNVALTAVRHRAAS